MNSFDVFFIKGFTVEQERKEKKWYDRRGKERLGRVKNRTVNDETIMNKNQLNICISRPGQRSTLYQ